MDFDKSLPEAIDVSEQELLIDSLVSKVSTSRFSSVLRWPVIVPIAVVVLTIRARVVSRKSILACRKFQYHDANFSYTRFSVSSFQ